MAEISDVVPGQDVLAQWGNEVRDRVVMRYSTLTALETAEPSAPDGSLRWADDVGLVIRQGGAWEAVLSGSQVTLSEIRDTADILRVSITAGGDLILRDETGAIGFLYDQSQDSWRFFDGRRVQVAGLLQADGGLDRTADFTFNSVSPVDSTTVSGSPYTLPSGSCSIPRAGLYRLTASGFVEASSNVNTDWKYLAKTGGGTVVMETRAYVYGSVSTTVRANMNMGNLFRFSGSNTLTLSVERTNVQGTNLFREYQIVAERLGD